MGYFANGSQIEVYVDTICAHCLNFEHDEASCPILDAHWMGNYEQLQSEDVRTILNMFIERLAPSNGVCKMFLPVSYDAVKQAKDFQRVVTDEHRKHVEIHGDTSVADDMALDDPEFTLERLAEILEDRGGEDA